jgi:hypothetical protein
MRIFDLPTSKARYELKVVLVPLHLWRVNVKAICGFIHIPLADLPTCERRPFWWGGWRAGWARRAGPSRSCLLAASSAAANQEAPCRRGGGVTS